MVDDERRLVCAKRLCAGRTMRRDEFPEELFGDYAWSMLMLAYIAKLEGRTIAADALYADAGVVAAVGSRWMAYLVEADLMAPGGNVQLTPSAASRIQRYVDRVIDIAAGQPRL